MKSKKSPERLAIESLKVGEVYMLDKNRQRARHFVHNIMMESPVKRFKVEPVFTGVLVTSFKITREL